MPLIKYFGFVGSALVLLLIGSGWCFPQPPSEPPEPLTGDNLTRRQVADVFAKFLKENPESRQKPGPSLAIEAFSKGFGCKRQ
jgi:hypothetical protein